jgi:hypothetical protein
MLSHPSLYDSCLPVRDWERTRKKVLRHKEQWSVLFAPSTLLMQFASHKEPSPPAAKGLSLKHKHSFMRISSMLTGHSQSPEGLPESDMATMISSD